MRPSNHFENITEDEFNARERNKAEYRKELQRQIDEVERKKQLGKKKKMLEDIGQDERIYKEL